MLSKWLTKKCLVCVKKFSKGERSISWWKKAKFCSRKCFFEQHVPPNKGVRGIQKAWNKGRKMPEIAGEKHPMWKGGVHKMAHGYIQVYSPNHPRKSHNNYVLQHRLVMEKKMGRFLKKEEDVHHLDGNRSNNTPENLMLFPSRSEHIKYHFRIARG